MVNAIPTLSEPLDVTISSGTSITAAINPGGRILTGIIMPAAWTAADVTFQTSADGSTWVDVYDAFGEVTLSQAAASRYLAVEYAAFFGAPLLKVRSGTSATPVNQGADRTLTLMLGRHEGD